MQDCQQPVDGPGQQQEQGTNVAGVNVARLPCNAAGRNLGATTIQINAPTTTTTTTTQNLQPNEEVVDNHATVIGANQATNTWFSALNGPPGTSIGRLHLDEESAKFVCATYVKEKLFRQTKFITLHGDLDFSNDPTSPCRFMARELNIAEYELKSWWDAQKKQVYASFLHHRNNVVKAIRTVFVRKY
jgi:hypothetical protein